MTDGELLEQDPCTDLRCLLDDQAAEFNRQAANYMEAVRTLAFETLGVPPSAVTFRPIALPSDPEDRE